MLYIFVCKWDQDGNLIVSVRLCTVHTAYLTASGTQPLTIYWNQTLNMIENYWLATHLNQMTLHGFPCQVILSLTNGPLCPVDSVELHTSYNVTQSLKYPLKKTLHICEKVVVRLLKYSKSYTNWMMLTTRSSYHWQMVLSVQLHTVQSLFSSPCQVSRVTLKTDNCILTYHFGAQKQGEGY